MTCRAQLLLFILAALFSVSCRRVEPAKPRIEARSGDWVVDPSVPGLDQPPTGLSLFDALVGGSAPFPFSRLLDVIDQRAGGSTRPRRVLIPLGRSLQRSAGAPQFFRYPRAVAVFDSNSPSGETFIKDRLFLGYHEKAGVIEVISYNEQAGRFEFQLVENYKEGATPRMSYASRAVCTTCHQNHGPLFPTQLWDETNSNSRASRLLLAEGRDFYQFPIEQSADVPYQVDLAVHRANEFSAYQLVWMRADADTRAALLKTVLRCRLTGNCAAPEVEGQLVELWRKNWPDGLRIPNPEIPNRNPLAILSREGPTEYGAATAFLADRQKNIDQQFEPAVARTPLATWRGSAAEIQRVVAGLAGFLSDQDMTTLDASLSQTQAPVQEFVADCKMEIQTASRTAIRCDGKSPMGFSMQGRLGINGTILLLSTGSDRPVRDLEVVSGGSSIRLVRSAGGLSARCASGDRIEQIRLKGNEGVLVTRRDFSVLESAIDRMKAAGALESKPFQRAFMMHEIAELLP